MKAKVLNFIARLFIYFLFVALFWTPLIYLVRYQGFSENAILIAATIGILPLLFLFVPAFQGLLQRISSVKIQGIEIGFQQAIDESVKGSAAEQVTLTIDRGRDVIYGKANLEEFLNTLRRYLPNPSTRLIVSIDLRDGEGVYLPMLYFQSRHLLQLFDLRAFLFLDTRQEGIEKRVLGTITPRQVLNLLDGYINGLSKAFDNAVSEYRQLLLQGHVDRFIQQTWQMFYENVVQRDNGMRLTDGVFRILFGEYLEANVISYPLVDYDLLLRYLEPSTNYIILAQGDKVINVRSIDRVAREIARSAVKSAMLQALLNKKASEKQKAKDKDGT